MHHKVRELAMFNLAIDSKLLSCDLVKLKVKDIKRRATLLSRASIVQQKTHQAVQLEITEHTRDALKYWIRQAARN